MERGKRQKNTTRVDSARATMPFSSFFYLHLTNDREHAVQPSCSAFCSLFYHSTRCSIVERASAPTLRPSAIPPLLDPLFFLHRYTGRQEVSSRDVPFPFVPSFSYFTCFFLTRHTCLFLSFPFLFFFPPPSPFSVTFFYGSFLRRFFFLFLVLVLTLFLFLLGFFLAATVVRNSNRGSIWRHPS